MDRLRIRRYDYLVTGGAGFIGSHLCEELLRRGHSVLVLDDLSTGDLANLEDCVESEEFSYVIGSVLDESLVSEAVDLCGSVVHLAAAVGVRNIIDRPVETIEANVKGTENVLKAAEKKARPTFVASTSEVYGKSEAVPFREDGDIVLGATSRSRWSYACSKAVDEFLAQAYWKDKGLPVVVGRLFNTVGPRQSGRYGMVLPRFVSQALRGESITVYGDGRQTRCFSLVGEVVDCILDLLHCADAVGRVVNVGSTQEVTIMQLAETVRDLSDSDSEIVLVPYDEAYPTDFEDMRRRVPDVSLLHSLIGRAPEAGLEEIVRAVIGWAMQTAE
ncbi:MAG: GDP-mannose 4,6-dehydratase [Candidatus Fermentibacterota bacterium]